MHRKIYYREFYYNMNIIKMFMNNVITLLLAVRICEDSDNRGSDKRGCTVQKYYIVFKSAEDPRVAHEKGTIWLANYHLV